MCNSNNNYDKITELLKLADDLIYLFRKQDFYNGIRLHRDIVKIIADIFKAYDENNQFFIELEESLKNLLQAQEYSDYILMADIYELQIKQACKRELERLHGQGIWQNVNDFYSINYNAADKEIKSMLDMINADEEDIPDNYQLVENMIGGFSLKKKIDKGELIFSSINNPYADAKVMIDSFAGCESNSRYYIVLGLEFGYISSVLCEQEDIEHIYVFEHDKYVIKAAMHYRNMTVLLESGKVNIIYDSQLTRFGSKMASIKSDNEDVSIIIHRPSMMNISNKQLREKVEDFFLHQSSVLSQGKRLTGNFRKNTSDSAMKEVHYIDELKDIFQKKEVYFLAGGPSLEKNLDFLKSNGKEKIIVCVGTILKLLIKNNIVPDYVVMIDSQKGMMAQIDGINTHNLSLIYIPTLYYGVADAWQGKKYMAMQDDFEYTEAMAKQKQLMLFETGGSVSTFAIDFLLRFGCKKIVCMGLDLGFTDKRRHAGSQDSINTDYSLRKVKSVDGDYIYTSKNLDNYRLWIERRLDRRTDEEMKTEIFNMSQGAYINGMIHSPITD